MCGYVFVFTDPVKLDGAEVIASDQKILADAFLHQSVPERTVIDHEKRLLSLYNEADVLP